MEHWVEQLTQIIVGIDGFIWQPFFMPFVLLLVGGWLTIRTRLVQISHFKDALRMLFRRPRTDAKAGTITPFQALSTALAATVGNGNIGGVATAILIGGPGAIFWMWMSATFGMATKFAEATLGVHYRVDRGGGDLASGPMYYIARGLGERRPAKIMAGAFAFFGLCTALFGTGNMAQSNTIARTVVGASSSIFGIELSPWIPGAIVAAMTGLVLVGGIKRIASVSEALVPTMIVVYLAFGLAYVAMNATQLPHVLGLIFAEAFTPTAAVGGFAGASVSMAIAAGMSRGVLSNEAGLGSAPIAHGIANVDHPVEQGLVGVVEVFIDTIVVCTMTAFIILSSGLWTDASYQQASGDLTAAAMHTSIPGAPIVVAASSFLFGFSTLLGWCFYGEKCVEFLLGTRWIQLYRVVFTGLVFFGAIASVPLVWALGTLLNGLMAFPNLVGLLALSGVVAKLSREYFSRAKA